MLRQTNIFVLPSAQVGGAITKLTQ